MIPENFKLDLDKQIPSMTNRQVIIYSVVQWILTNILPILAWLTIMTTIWSMKQAWDNHLDRMYDLSLKTSEKISLDHIIKQVKPDLEGIKFNADKPKLQQFFERHKNDQD